MEILVISNEYKINNNNNNFSFKLKNKNNKKKKKIGKYQKFVQKKLYKLK